jgi:hypothetical protein
MGGGFTQDVSLGGFQYATPVSGAGVSASSDSSLTIAGADAIINKAQAATWTGAHVWDSEDNGTTSVPSLLSVQHRNNAAGTPAAGYGVGVLMKLDSSARNLRSAVELDAVWSTATDAAEVSSLAIKTMLAGVATETVRFGTGATLPDADFSTSLGRVVIDSRQTDSAFFAHRDMLLTTNFALRHTNAGASMLNSASGQAIAFAIAGSSVVTLDATNLTMISVKLKFAAGNEQTTIGAAGGASALPATPTKYFKVTDSAGTTLIIPAYAAV